MLIIISIFFPLGFLSGENDKLLFIFIIVIPVCIQIWYSIETNKIRLKYKVTTNRSLCDIIDDIMIAMKFERAKNYEKATLMWEELGVLDRAAKLRTAVSKQKSIKIAQKVVHGDEVTKTEIRDSVVSKSNVGGGGSSKMQELKELKEMRDSGDITDEDYEKMKREIIG